MMTAIALVIFLGFFCFYMTSKRAMLFQSTKVEVWLQNNATIAKCLGTVLLISGLELAILQGGLGAGVFTFFIFLMAAGSLIVMLAPLKFVNYKTISFVFALSLILELI